MREGILESVGGLSKCSRKKSRANYKGRIYQSKLHVEDRKSNYPRDWCRAITHITQPRDADVIGPATARPMLAEVPVSSLSSFKLIKRRF